MMLGLFDDDDSDFEFCGMMIASRANNPVSGEDNKNDTITSVKYPDSDEFVIKVTSEQNPDENLYDPFYPAKKADEDTDESKDNINIIQLEKLTSAFSSSNALVMDLLNEAF